MMHELVQQNRSRICVGDRVQRSVQQDTPTRQVDGAGRAGAARKRSAQSRPVPRLSPGAPAPARARATDWSRTSAECRSGPTMRPSLRSLSHGRCVPVRPKSVLTANVSVNRRRIFSQLALLALDREREVGYCRLVTISTDNLVETAAFSTAVGAHWPFLVRPGAASPARPRHCRIYGPGAQPDDPAHGRARVRPGAKAANS